MTSSFKASPSPLSSSHRTEPDDGSMTPTPTQSLVNSSFHMNRQGSSSSDDNAGIFSKKIPQTQSSVNGLIPQNNNNHNYNRRNDDHDDHVDDQATITSEVNRNISDSYRSVPTGTIFSSSINIANTILGSGMLAMPSALAATGLGLGAIMIVISGLASAFGLYLLSRVAAAVGRNSSFFNCAMITYPKAAIAFDIAIALKCFGVSISYLIICGDLIPQVVTGFIPSISETPESLYLRREFWITVAMILISPFCFLKQLNSLRYTSAFALLAVVYLIFITVLYFFAPPFEGMPPRPSWSDVEWIKLDMGLLTHFPVFVFSFTCHQNIFAVYNELIDNSPRQIQSVIGISVGTSFVVYEVIGIIGYLTFGPSVKSNVIAMYPASALVTGGQLAIAMLVLLSYPLQLFPCRASLYKVVYKTDDMTEGKRTTLTLCIMFASFLVAVSIRDLSTILGFVGATGSTSICYILPGLFFYKLYQIMNPETSLVQVLLHASQEPTERRESVRPLLSTRSRSSSTSSSSTVSLMDGRRRATRRSHEDTDTAHSTAVEQSNVSHDIGNGGGGGESPEERMDDGVHTRLLANGGTDSSTLIRDFPPAQRASIESLQKREKDAFIAGGAVLLVAFGFLVMFVSLFTLTFGKLIH